MIYWLSLGMNCKPEMISNEVVNLARDISRQKAENANWLILSTYDKAFQERDELKKGTVQFSSRIWRKYIQRDVLG